MKIDICIPAYNEERIIRESVLRVHEEVKKFASDWRIVVAENASIDNTADEAEAAGATVLRLSERGKVYAGISAAQGSDADIFGFIDADLSADPAEIGTLLVELEAGADVVIGSRLMRFERVRRGIFRTFTSKIFNILRRTIVGLNVSDTQCRLKIMNRRGAEVLAACTEKGWFFDMEFLARAERAGRIIKEVPVAWEEFRYSNRTSKLNVLTDGFASVRAMLRIRRKF